MEKRKEIAIMAERTLTAGPPARKAPGGIEDQLWPIVCATAVLAGVLTVVIFVNSDFEDERLLLNGYTHLAAVALFAAAIIFLSTRVKNTVRRTAELCILASLAIHGTGGLAAVYLFAGSVTASSGMRGDMSDAVADSDDTPPPPADYHWGENDEQQGNEAEQAFEKPVATAIRDQAPPAAQVQPRNLDRPVPVAEVPRAAKPDFSPLGVGAATEPGRPLDVRRPDAAKLETLPPAEALAMVRQKGMEAPIPEAQRPAPLAMPEAPKESAKSIEPGVQAEKADKFVWAKVATRSVDPNNNNAPAPPPRKMARADVQAPEALPAPGVVAQLPSQAPPRTSSVQAGPEAADAISQQGSTLDRSNRDGASMPSTVVPDAGLPAQSSAAEGGSPPSRLEAVSTVAVERSDNTQAPQGPTIASAGTQDFGRGSSLLPTRRGAIGGTGKALPSIEGDTNVDPGEIRAGSPASNLDRGLAAPAGPARRAIASQTEGGGTGLSAGQGATLPRTQAEMGLPLPVASRVADDSNVSGAGGVGPAPGSMTSTLDVGQNVAVRRIAGNGTPRGNSRDAVLSGGGTGDVALSGVGGAGGTAPGTGSAGPRRIEQGAGEGNADGLSSIPRTPGQVFDPRATVDPVGPVSGTANVTRGPVPGAGPQGYSNPAIGPEISLGGTGRLYGPGQRIGSHPTAPIEPAEIASSGGLTSPQRSGGAGHGGQGDGQLDQLLSGGQGVGGVGRGRSQVVVNSLVHEPLDAFRHGTLHGGPTLGDSDEGQLTEPAIEKGLEYFAHTQFPDGHWSLHETPPGAALDPASLGELHADTAATGLALLSYMAAGYTHEDEKYREAVRRGLDWLVKHQADDGNLSYHGSEPTMFYSHGIAAMALCEAYGMTQDRDLRAAAQKAIDFIVRSQDPNRGGWRYQPQDGSDTSVTGWQLMALRSAQMAGLNVPQETLQKVGHWLDLAQVPNRGTYVYNPWNLDTTEERNGRAPSPTMTAQAMIMRMYLGQDQNPELLRQGADFLKGHLPEVGTTDASLRDCYYWYYATQAMYHMQGDYWKAWDARITPLLRAGQIEKGPLKGSWSGTEPVPDRWGSKAGRHYVTAMHVLTLEFRYWHLPLFRELRRE